MADLVWYRSLYWRIALGFVALLATLLVLQVLVFLWISGRMDDLFPNRTPAQFAGTIATDLSAELARAADARRRCVREFALLGCVTRISPSCCRTVALSSAVVFRRRRSSPRIARSRLFDDPYSDRRSGGPFSWPRSRTETTGRDFGRRPVRRARRTERSGGRVRVHQRERHGRGDCGRAGRAAAAVDDACATWDRRWPSSPWACWWSARRSRRSRSFGRHAGV